MKLLSGKIPANKLDYYSLVTDTIAPSVTSIIPANGAIDVSLSQGISITFDEAVQIGTLNVELRRQSDDVALYDYTVPDVIFSNGDKTVSFQNHSLINSENYYLFIAAGSFTDKAITPNSFDGVAKGEWNFATVASGGTPTIWESIDYNDSGNFDLGPVTQAEIQQYIQWATKGVDAGNEHVNIQVSGDGLNVRNAEAKFPKYEGGAHTFQLASHRFVTQTGLPLLTEIWWEFFFYIPQGRWITQNQGKIGFSINGQNGTGAGNNPTTDWDMLYHWFSCANNPKQSAIQGAIADPPGPHGPEDMVVALDMYWNDVVNPLNSGYSEQIYQETVVGSGIKKKFTHSILYGQRGHLLLNSLGLSDGILEAWYNEDGGAWTKSVEFTGLDIRGAVDNKIGQFNCVPFFGGNGGGYHPQTGNPDKNNGIDYPAQDTYLRYTKFNTYTSNPGW